MVNSTIKVIGRPV